MGMKSVTLSLAALTVISTILSVVPVYAQTTDTMTDAHISRIKSNCQVALATLSQIHANDAPIYINRNQTYFSISDKLMARLNSRLTLDRYDATQLVKISSDYNTALAKFRTVYKQYDDIMAAVVHMDCNRQPVSFYDKVGSARIARQKVHDTVVQMTAYIDQYQSAVQAFQTLHASALEGGRS